MALNKTTWKEKISTYYTKTSASQNFERCFSRWFGICLDLVKNQWFSYDNFHVNNFFPPLESNKISEWGSVEKS